MDTSQTFGELWLHAKIDKNSDFSLCERHCKRVRCQTDIIGVPKPGQWESSEQKKLQADCF